MKLLPHSEDAEKGVIAAMLMDPRTVGGICAEMQVTPASFHVGRHSLIYGLLLDAWANGKTVDFIVLTGALRDAGKLEEVGGAAYITELFTLLPTVALVREHIGVVQEKRQLRELLLRCRETAGQIEACQDASALIAGHLEAISSLSSGAKSGYVPMKERVMQKIDRMQTADSNVGRILTGIGKLDSLSPMKRGDMPVLSGERKAGKSMLAISIARNVLKAGGAVFYASLEQPNDEQVDRLLHGLIQVPTVKSHTSRLNEGEMQRFMGIEKASDWRFDLRDDLDGIADILGSLRQAKARWPDLHLGIVDYAQLVRGVRLKGDTREMEVASVSRMLRRAAIDLHCAIILLCQLNKQGESRESMVIEQDMTAMWKLSSQEEEEGEPDEGEGDNPQERILSIPRQRNGRSGIGFKLLFQGHLGTVTDLVRDDLPQTKPTKRDYHK